MRGNTVLGEDVILGGCKVQIHVLDSVSHRIVEGLVRMGNQYHCA